MKHRILIIFSINVNGKNKKILSTYFTIFTLFLLKIHYFFTNRRQSQKSLLK